MNFKRKILFAMTASVILILNSCNCDDSILDGSDWENSDWEILESLKDTENLKSLKIVNISDYKDYHNYAKNGKYSEYAKEMHNAIVKINKDKAIDKNEYKQKFFKQIEMIKKPVCFDEEPTEIEILIYEELISRFQYEVLEYRLATVDAYVNYIENNVCDENIKDRLLYTIEIISLVYNNFDNSSKLKSTKISSLSGVPILKSANEYGGVLLTDCQHECMESKINAMNAVDWIAAAVNPSAYFGWMLAACIYQCL